MLELKLGFGIAPTDVVIGTAGRLVEQKGFTYLLDAIDQMRNNGVKDFRLLLLGSGELEQELHAQAERLGIDDIVIFTGFRDDARRLLSVMDVFVF